MEFSNILVKEEQPAARITLNRPEKRNALSLALMREVIEALELLRTRDGIRAVIIEGAGRAFSAGHDLEELVDREPGFYKEIFQVCTDMMESIHRTPQPVVAKVHGVATAAGCQLVASCDLAIAEEGARFATPGVKIGLFCSTPMVPVSRAVGRKRAMEMLLTGDFIDAHTAREWGLINAAAPSDRLEDSVQELIAKISSSSPLTVGIGKEAFYSQIELDEHRAYDLTKSVMSMNSLAGDAQEGICAFLDKRSPHWRGR
ncbi:MAG: enoyl-CoA hydratase [Actinomycetota bacterium]